MQAVTDPVTRREILDAYFDYFSAYVERDWERMVHRFDPNMTMFGTGVDEMALDGEATLRLFAREFQQAPAKASFRIKSTGVFHIAPETALVVLLMDLEFKVGEAVLQSRDNRTSAVMIQTTGTWTIAHAHWSQPDLDQDPGESLPFKQLLEENRRLEALIARRTEELRNANAELTDALAKVKTLKGILPICSHCKKIRNDAGYWTQIERYISEYTDAFFSHSVCPECLQTHYVDELNRFKEHGSTGTNPDEGWETL